MDVIAFAERCHQQADRWHKPDGDDEEQHDHGDGTAVPRATVVECLDVLGEGDDSGDAKRTAVVSPHYEDEVEHLDHVNDHRDGHDGDRRAEQRDLYPGEDLKGSRAVNSGGL